MLIRVNDTLRACPDDLAALILLDPSCDDGPPDFSLEEVNAIVHGVSGTFYKENLSWEMNIEQVRQRYASLPSPDAADLSAALKLVENCKQNITLKDVGRVPAWLVI